MLKYKISVHSLKNQVTLKKEQIEGTQSYFEDDDNKESNS